ncbi:MAG: xanthine dehydrogenase family protein molybdopterin-binding subunit, partial [Syntrophomonadaceae bacterium]|nr:xanthine dehydrogenase family protein molybdopterin-binding subunit [Syntrophomonadaceae bacterium]
YRIPGSKDIPNIHTEFIVTDEPNGPFGAKGIGECAINPVAPAVVNAICNAIGVEFNELPVTPEKVLAALKATGKNS